MSLFKCKHCGEALDLSIAVNGVCKCNLCNMYQTVSTREEHFQSTEALYGSAANFRKNKEFDLAISTYQQILALDDSDAEAYFSVALCRYGIEYVKDPKTENLLPTVNRTQLKAFSEDDDFILALENATGEQRAEYLKQAELIDEILRGYWQISNGEDPFDVFICYKETALDGESRTEDSAIAAELYRALTNDGIKVFFARETLKDKLGSEYEPYIFAALNSARFMLVIGTRKEHVNAVWVKNEWSRYSALIKQGKRKTLIPVYKYMKPSDLPSELRNLQGMNYGDIGTKEDILIHIEKVLKREKPETLVVKETTKVVEQPVYQEPKATGTQGLIKRGYELLEQGKFEQVLDCCERIIDKDFECGEGYFIKFLAENKFKTVDEFEKRGGDYKTDATYKKALLYADEKLKKMLYGIEKNSSKIQDSKDKLPGKGKIDDSRCASGNEWEVDSAGILKFPRTQTKIESGAVLNNEKVAAIGIHAGITEIEPNAFQLPNAKFAMIDGTKTKFTANAFTGCPNLSAIILNPEHELYMQAEDGAIYDKSGKELIWCASLTIKDGVFEIPHGVEKLGTTPFTNCRMKLRTVKIPDTVSEMDNNPFMGLILLEQIDVSAGNKKYKSVDGNLYSKDGSELIAYAGGKQEKFFEVPSGVAKINAAAFVGAPLITEIKIPQTVEEIDMLSISACPNLVKINIPKSVRTVGQLALISCQKLTVYCEAAEQPSGWNAMWTTPEIQVKWGVPDKEKELYTKDGNYIYFGSYPQTLKADNVSITGSQNEKGHYLGSDGEYYAKVIAKPYAAPRFSTGRIVEKGKEYYFKVEPIKWRILSNKGKEALILCESVIDARRFDATSNNYENSEIRKWLNDEFYEKAFNDLQKKIIRTTEVDNSVSSTGHSSNQYACANTRDMIFLLSVADVTNTAYGFNGNKDGDGKRIKTSSDYALANGVYKAPNGNSNWRLRSPYNYRGDCIECVLTDGNVAYGGVDNSDIGFLPALYIMLDIKVNTEKTKASYDTKTSKVSTVTASECSVSPSGEAVFSEGITEIPSGAFKSSRDLRTVIIPEGVTKIGREAFAHCKGILCLVLPSTLKEICEKAFVGCDSLKSINLPSGLIKIEASAFEGCASLRELILPEGIEKIGTEAFKGCTSLIEVTVPSGVQAVGENVFADSEIVKASMPTQAIVAFGKGLNIKEVVLTCGDTIPEKAFERWEDLEVIHIPSTVKKIEDNAFSGCYSINDVHITDLKKWCEIEFVDSASNPMNDGAYLYLNGMLIDELVISNKITSVSESAFSGCNLKKVVIENGAANIGRYAFENCADLGEIVLEGYQGWLGRDTLAFDMAFYECYPERITASLEAFRQIDEYCLEKMGVAHVVVNGDDLFFDEEEYKTAVFDRNKLLETVTILDGVSEIRDEFKSCSSLKSVKFSGTVKKIVNSFGYCDVLEEVIIPEGVEEVCGSFEGCEMLKCVTVSSTVNKLDSSFEMCYKIKSYNVSELNSHYASIDGNLYKKLVNNELRLEKYSNEKPERRVVIPNGVTEIASFAFAHNNFAEEIILPKSLEMIEEYAFYGCSVKSVYIGENIKTVKKGAFAYSKNVTVYCAMKKPSLFSDVPNGWDPEWNSYKDEKKTVKIKVKWGKSF